jgi:hypothetical protein
MGIEHLAAALAAFEAAETSATKSELSSVILHDDILY